MEDAGQRIRGLLAALSAEGCTEHEVVVALTASQFLVVDAHSGPSSLLGSLLTKHAADLASILENLDTSTQPGPALEC